MTPCRGFTLVEMVTALVIGVFIILSVALVGNISIKASNKARQEPALYSDLSYAFEVLKYDVRAAVTAPQIVAASGGYWVSGTTRLNVGNGTFGIQQDGFVHCLDYSVQCDPTTPANRKMLFFRPNGTMNFINFSVSGTSPLIARLWGSRDNAAFDMSAQVTRRN
jgi:hypothetical protein